MDVKYYIAAEKAGELAELKNHLSMNGYVPIFGMYFNPETSTSSELIISNMEMFGVETILKDRNIRFANSDNLIAEAIEVIMKKVEDGTIPTVGKELSFKEKVSFEKRWSYQLRHYSAYGVDENFDGFVTLLNMLQANNENLDSLHNATFNGHRDFMGIFGSWNNDFELANTVKDFNVFDPSINSLATRIAENAFFNDETIEENLGNCELYKTHDGFVERLHY